MAALLDDDGTFRQSLSRRGGIDELAAVDNDASPRLGRVRDAATDHKRNGSANQPGKVTHCLTHETLSGNSCPRSTTATFIDSSRVTRAATALRRQLVRLACAGKGAARHPQLFAFNASTALFAQAAS